jgi:hypothetical protein
MVDRVTAAADGPTASDPPAQRQGAELESQAELEQITGTLRSDAQGEEEGRPEPSMPLEPLVSWLGGLGLKELKARLHKAGVSDDAIGALDDEDNPKSTAVEMLAAALVGPSDSREPAKAATHGAWPGTAFGKHPPGAETKKWLAGVTQPLHGEFVFDDSPAQLHKYAVMPPGSCASRKGVTALTKHWGLTAPNLILKMNYSCHDAGELVYEEMLKELPDYCDLTKKLSDEGGLRDSSRRGRRSPRSPRRSPRSPRLESPRPAGVEQAESEPDGAMDREQGNLRTANKYLETRLTSLWTQLASACAMTNSWILLKHREGRGGNDALLAKVMKSSSAKPVFLDVLGLVEQEITVTKVTVPAKLVDAFIEQLELTDNREANEAHFAAEKGSASEDRKGSRKTEPVLPRKQAAVGMKDGEHQWSDYAKLRVWQVGSEQEQGFRTDLDRVKAAVRAAGSSGQDDIQVTFARDTLLQAGPENMYRRVAENNEILRDPANTKPWSTPLGEPTTIRCVDGGGHVSTRGGLPLAGEGSIEGKQTVLYSYFNSEATHHVFTQNPKEFAEKELGPTGNIFSGGNSVVGCKRLMIDAMRNGEACIFLDNTGGESQELARLINFIQDQERHWEAPVDGRPFDATRDLNIREMLAHAKLGQTKIPEKNRGGWMNHLTNEDVLTVCDLYSERRDLFNETIIVVNPLKESPDEVLTRLAKCIASVQATSNEVGAGPADHNAIFDAWRVHKTLVDTASRRRVSADRLAAVAIIVTFMATATAILDGWIKSQVESEEETPHWLEGWEGGAGDQAIRAGVIILPAVGGLIASVIAEGSYLDKWATNHLAAVRVRGELYRFRMRVGRYSITGHQSGGDGDASDVSSRMLRARQAFSARIQSLTRETMGQQLGESLGTLQKTGNKEQDGVELHTHVMASHYGRQPISSKSVAGRKVSKNGENRFRFEK